MEIRQPNERLEVIVVEETPMITRALVTRVNDFDLEDYRDSIGRKLSTTDLEGINSRISNIATSNILKLSKPMIIDLNETIAYIEDNVNNGTNINFCIDNCLGILKRNLENYRVFRNDLNTKGIEVLGMYNAIMEYKVENTGAGSISVRFLGFNGVNEKQFTFSGQSKEAILIGLPRTIIAEERFRQQSLYGALLGPFFIGIQNKKSQTEVEHNYEVDLHSRVLYVNDFIKPPLTEEEAISIRDNYLNYLERCYENISRFIEEIEQYKIKTS